MQELSQTNPSLLGDHRALPRTIIMEETQQRTEVQVEVEQPVHTENATANNTATQYLHTYYTLHSHYTSESDRTLLINLFERYRDREAFILSTEELTRLNSMLEQLYQTHPQLFENSALPRFVETQI